MTENLDLKIGFWRSKLADYRSDSARLAQFAAVDEHRRAVLPEIVAFLRSFLDGSIDIEHFRAEFDQRTRVEWDGFGLKGLSGAMFLNKLVKHLPRDEAVFAGLKSTLEVPPSHEEAERRMRSFAGFLEGRIESGATTRALVQPSRVPFFVSACWHLQAVEDWPIYYNSARKALRANTGYQHSESPVESYFAFASYFMELKEELDLPMWELEHLCVWMEEAGPGPKPPPPPVRRYRVWLVSPGRNAEFWDEFYEGGIIGIGWDFLGDLTQYDALEDFRRTLAEHRESEVVPVHDAMACYQFANELKRGDVIYAKKGRTKIVGRGTIASDYLFDDSRESMKHTRKVEWDKRGEWVPREKSLVTKTLTEIGQYPGLVRDIEAALGEEEAPPDDVKPPEPYDLELASAEIFMTRSEIADLLDLLKSRKNVVLQGPPGTGKSFIASRLAWLALEGKDSERLATVQFHQSYSYEDFVQGYRPTESGGFERRDGPFMRFCNLALQDQDNAYVLIIDEINRGNLSKILGELMMLIEPDKRGEEWATHLAYSAEDEAPFHVPANLLIIGTMNTADRSLALVDYALRRRFAFVDVEPAFSNPGFQGHLEELGADSNLRGQIESRMVELNAQVAADRALGRGFMIGHSYFCQREGEPASEEWFERIVRTEIAPLLREYWFDVEEKAEKAMAMLLESV